MPSLLARTHELTWRELIYPRPMDAASAVERIHSLACDPHAPLVALEVRATGNAVRFVVGTEESTAMNRVVQHLGATAVDLVTPRRQVNTAKRFAITNRRRPLNTDALDITTRAILDAASRAGQSEEIVIQVLLGPRLSAYIVPTDVRQPVPIRRLLIGGGDTMDRSAREALIRKVASPGFASIIRVGASAAKPSRRRELVLGVLAAFRCLAVPGVSIGLQSELPERIGSGSGLIAPWRWPLRLNVHEVAAVTAMPVGDDDIPGLPSLHPKQSPPVIGPFLPSEHRVVVAKATAPGIINLPDHNGRPTEPMLTTTFDALLRHRHIIGPTGVGKSVLLANLTLQHIDRGFGAVVIEPKGDLVTDILARIPEHRRDDVVVLDPTAERVVGINPLAGDSRPELRADAVLSVFTSLFRRDLGPRSTDVLHACLLTLAQRSDAALTQIPRLLTDAKFRSSRIGTVANDAALGPFWAWYNALTPEAQATIVAPLMNKLRALILKPSIRAVLGQTSPKFDVHEVFTANKILLVPVPVATLGKEGSALLGSLVVSQLWDAARERALVPPDQRQPVSIVLDECQHFMRLPTDLADALATSRSYGVGWTLAHQFMDQLPADMRSAVLHNARTRVAFQLARADAKTFAATATGRPEQRPTADDFTSLPAFHIYASLFEQGQVQPYASGQTLPLQPAVADADALRKLSAERYGRSVADVETELSGDPVRAPKPLLDAPSGRRRRTNREGDAP